MLRIAHLTEWTHRRSPLTRSRLILAGILVVGGAIRFATLDLQSYHHDEAVTAGRVLPVGFGEMLGLVVETERSPYLYYLCAWLWSQLFGVGEAGLRSLSAVVGTATIAAAYFAGRELAGKRAGLITAALVATSPVLIWYSLEARSYGFLILFSTLALGFCALSLNEPRPRHLVLWALSAALAVASHYFAVFVIAPQAVWLLYRHAHRAWAALAIAGVTVAGLALVPLAVAQQGGRSEGIFTERSLLFRLAETAKTFMTAERPRPLAGNTLADIAQVAATSAAGALLALGVLAALSWSDAELRRRVWVALSGGVVGVAAPFLLAVVGVDFANPRNMLGSVVPLLTAAAIGFSLEPRDRSAAIPPRLGIAGMVLVVGAFGMVAAAQVVSAQFQRYDWRSAAQAIGHAEEPRVIVVNQNGDNPLLYYLEGSERFDNENWEQGARVRQVVTLNWTDAVRTPPGFEFVDKEGLAPTFVLYRFRAARPQLLKPHHVRQGDVLLERSLALIDGDPAPAP